MNKTTTTRYDVAEHLRTQEEMAAYLEACLEEADGDAAFIAKALGDIARAKGMAQVARDAGLSRESLYKALSGERSPDFATILKVVGALGLKLHAQVPLSKSRRPTFLKIGRPAKRFSSSNSSKMKKHYDFAKMKGRKNPYIKYVKQPVTG